MGCANTKAAAPAQGAKTPQRGADGEHRMPTLLNSRRGSAAAPEASKEGTAGTSDSSEAATTAKSNRLAGALGGAQSSISKGLSGAAHAVSAGASGAVHAVSGHSSREAQAEGAGASSAAASSGEHGATHRASDSKAAEASADSVPQHSWRSLFDAAQNPLSGCCSCQGSLAPGDEVQLAAPGGGADNMLGKLVHSLLNSFDTSTLGVKVDMGAMHLEATTGRVEVHGLTVHNPEGYHSPYLLHADRVVADLDMQKLIFSFGKEVDVEELVFEGVDVIFEKALSTSNLNDLLHKLPGADEQKATAKGQQSSKSDIKLTLHRVLAKNIGAKVATVATHGVGARLEVGDISYQDFDKEIGPGRGFVDIVRVLLMTIIKSVFATVLGKDATKALLGGVQAAHRGLSKGFSGTFKAAKRAGSSASLALGIQPKPSQASQPGSSSDGGRRSFLDVVSQPWASCCGPPATSTSEGSH